MCSRKKKPTSRKNQHEIQQLAKSKDTREPALLSSHRELRNPLPLGGWEGEKLGWGECNQEGEPAR